MGNVMERPTVTKLADGSAFWEHTYLRFRLKAYAPANNIDGQVNNYSFRAPLLFVFEEKEQTMEEAVAFANNSGLSRIAAPVDATVLFVYPTNEGGWKKADVDLYKELIAEVRMDPMFEDGIVSFTNFFTQTFEGYFIKGAKFRTDIYSFGESADYVAKNLLKTVEGEYLWGPGVITPAMCSMERLNVIPEIERKDIAILSVGNSDEINASFEGCENLLIKDEAEYEDDFNRFVKKYKMWCNNNQLEPDFEAMNMTEEPGETIVQTSDDNIGIFKGTKEHKAGYFAYYNNDLFDNGPVPLVMGFHGGGDSSMYLTFVAEWYEIAHRYNFLFVSVENHMFVTATEVIEMIEHLKKKYNIDEKRIYATGFSMGSGKTWDLYQQYPEVFAGMAPCSALFPMKDNPFAPIDLDKINHSISVPMFYSGGEESPLPELPCQAESCLDRVQYVAEVNKLKNTFDTKYEDKDKWENPIYGFFGDRVEKIYDETRDSYLTVNYFDSTDGVCRTALASVSKQSHECRHHSCENAWKFISRFERP